MHTESQAIALRGLTKRYSNRRGSVNALTDVSFGVSRGESFGFLGPNGAGKTTTLRILATILTPTTGTAQVEGNDIERDSMAVRSLIGYVPEKAGAYPLLTGLQNLLYWARLQDVDRMNLRERAKSLLTELGLEEAADRKVKTYSFGMTKRLMVAQALIHDPSVFLLDEPAGGLDPQGIRFFRDLVRRLKSQGKTVLLSSHILSEVEQTCAQVAVIHRGKILAVGRMDDLRRRLGSSQTISVKVECDTLSSAAILALQGIPGVRAAHPESFGTTVEVVPGSDVVAEITRILVENRLRIRAIRPQEPTLEDAYMSLIGGGTA